MNYKSSSYSTEFLRFHQEGGNEGHIREYPAIIKHQVRG